MQARALPKATDGRYDYQVKPKTDTDQSSDQQHSYLWRAEKRLEEDAKFLKVFRPEAVAVRNGPQLH